MTLYLEEENILLCDRNIVKHFLITCELVAYTTKEVAFTT